MRASSVFACASAILGIACFPSGCDGLSAAIQQYGFTELKPPSNLMQPGTVVAIRHRSPFQGKIICTAEESLGSDFKPRVSPTESSVLNSNRLRDIKIGAQFLDEFKTDDNLHALESVSISLTNPSIATLPDTEVERGMRHRSRDCTRAIQARLDKGFSVTMITQTLQGDMVIKAKWDKDAKIEGTAKVAALQELALNMGAEASSASEKMAVSKGLIIGVKADQYLAALSIEGLDERLIKDRRESLLPDALSLCGADRYGNHRLAEHRPGTSLGRPARLAEGATILDTSYLPEPLTAPAVSVPVQTQFVLPSQPATPTLSTVPSLTSTTAH